MTHWKHSFRTLFTSTVYRCTYRYLINLYTSTKMPNIYSLSQKMNIFSIIALLVRVCTQRMLLGQSFKWHMACSLQKKNKKTGIDRLAEHVVTLGSWNMGVRIVNTRRISAGWKHLRFWLKHNPIDSRAKCLKLQRWSKSW